MLRIVYQAGVGECSAPWQPLLPDPRGGAAATAQRVDRYLPPALQGSWPKTHSGSPH